MDELGQVGMLGLGMMRLVCLLWDLVVLGLFGRWAGGMGRWTGWYLCGCFCLLSCGGVVCGWIVECE